MRNITVLLLLLITLTGFSKKKKIQVFKNERIVGKSLVDSSVIKGSVYVFSNRINETFLDTITGLLTAQLRGVSKNGKWLKNTGHIVQYDLKNQKVLWSKKIAYQSNRLQQFSNIMIYSAFNKSCCLDRNTGNELWEVKNNIYFVDPVDNIGIGYNSKKATKHRNELEGIDLKSGKVVWKRDIDRKYGWNDIFYTNDSTVIVAAAGLHSVNINNGEGWDYNTKSGKKNYSLPVAANVAGAVLGLLTGSFVASTGHQLVRDIVSNSLVDSAYIYFASKEQLSKIDKQTGDIVWKYPFSKNLSSKSSIFMNDSVVYMVNNGYAFMGDRKLNFGKPFFAAFDRESGKQKFFLINDKDDSILSYKIQNREIYLVFENRIVKYSMETGDRIVEKEFPKKRFGKLRCFIGDEVFIKNKNRDLVSLPQSDSTKVFVFTNQGKTLSVDGELNCSKTIEYDDLNFYYLHTGDYNFIAKDNKTLIINDEGKRIAELEATQNAFLIGKTLYDKSDNSFIAVNLKEIIKDK